MKTRSSARRTLRRYTKAYLAERSRVIAEGSAPPAKDSPDAIAVRAAVIRDLSRPWV